MESLYNIWKSNTIIGNSRWSLSGNSVAGIRTSFYSPELKIQLDAGYQNFNKVNDIFITHSHADHVASLPLIILENISNKQSTKIYCPEETVELLNNMIDSFLMCNYNNNRIPKKYYQVIGLNSDYLIDLKLNSQDISVQSFNSDHTVPTLSYGFIQKSKKLKEEYIGKSSQEIVELKKSGVDITYIIEYKKLVFCGDTSIAIFENNPSILNFDNIVIECTFFDESDLRLAVERKHMHWLQLKPIIRNNPNINFYLIHISAKYTDKNKLLEEVNEDLSNVFLL